MMVILYRQVLYRFFPVKIVCSTDRLKLNLKNDASELPDAGDKATIVMKSEFGYRKFKP